MKYKLVISEEGFAYLPKKDASKLIREGYGLIDDEFLILESFEALYLSFKGLANLEYEGKELSFEEALSLFSKFDEKCWEKFLVYMKLRDRNYVVKKGYGDDYVFLLYEKGESSKNEAASYIVSILHEGKNIRMDKLDEMLAFAIRMRKTILFAVLDSNSDVSFYEASKIKL